MRMSQSGDLATSFRLRHLNASLKNRAETLGRELASGEVADPAKSLHGGTDRLAAVERAVSMAKSYAMATEEFSYLAEGQQAVLAHVQDVGQTTAARLLVVRTAPTEVSVDSVAGSAAEALRTSIAALNRQVAGRSLFAGAATHDPALAGHDLILDDLEALTAGMTTAADVVQAVDDYFNQPGGGFETSAYLGSAQPMGEVNISAQERAQLATTAADPRIRRALQGLATAAILSRGVLSGDADARAEVVNRAGETTLSSVSGLVAAQAEIGLTQERVETVATRNQAQDTAAKLALARMRGADGYETATHLKDVETRLEALYLSTARLSQLSLVRFLR